MSPFKPELIDVSVGKFLGLQRATMIYVVILLLALTWGTTLYQIHQIQDVSSRNSTAQAALCIFRSDLISRRDSNQKFLNMTKEQRIRKYGEIGKIPDVVLKQQLQGQNRTIASLDSLRCH